MATYIKEFMLLKLSRLILKILKILKNKYIFIYLKSCNMEYTILNNKF